MAESEPVGAQRYFERRLRRIVVSDATRHETRDFVRRRIGTFRAILPEWTASLRQLYWKCRSPVGAEFRARFAALLRECGS